MCRSCLHWLPAARAAGCEAVNGEPPFSWNSVASPGTNCPISCECRHRTTAVPQPTEKHRVSWRAKRDGHPPTTHTPPSHRHTHKPHCRHLTDAHIYTHTHAHITRFHISQTQTRKHTLTQTHKHILAHASTHTPWDWRETQDSLALTVRFSFCDAEKKGGFLFFKTLMCGVLTTFRPALPTDCLLDNPHPSRSF